MHNHVIRPLLRTRDGKVKQREVGIAAQETATSQASEAARPRSYTAGCTSRISANHLALVRQDTVVVMYCYVSYYLY
jgi:hypothetical protein